MIVLDTHALVWWASDPGRVPARSRRLIEKAVADDVTIAVSSITIWEIAMLVAAARLTLTMDVTTWLGHVQALPFLSFMPVDNQIALRAVQLPGFPHRDPADRMITATTLGLGATLVTADSRLRGYRPLRTVWD